MTSGLSPLKKEVTNKQRINSRMCAGLKSVISV